eukprot:TRINITY_DN58466_c0_g1_i1.p1 TRINITY_DN58466_c0_g1~~TRINITY_DN58466_c0_g1_i1.p1  ORF type:complete len:501 (-),score=50.75 TRINITY_DN58466_c0_g1_i1:193-1695(-)
MPSGVHWEVQTGDGWIAFDPGVPFEGRSGSEIKFSRGSFKYKAVIENAGNGFQENLITGRKRALRSVLSVSALNGSARSSGDEVPSEDRPGGSPATNADEQWQDTYRSLKKNILSKLPRASDSVHPGMAALARAEAAEKERCWEVAFNELLSVNESMIANGATSSEGVSGRTNEDPRSATSSSSAVAPASEAEVKGVKRTATSMLGEATGEPRHVARRLLDEAKGDQDEAFSRWLRIHDLANTHGQILLNATDVDCAICVETVNTHGALRLLRCDHGWYCISCVRRMTSAKIGDGSTIGSIGCPECGSAFDELFLKAVLTADQMERLHHQGLESAVGSCAGLRPCPTPDCPNRVVLEDGVEPRLFCGVCRKEHCLLCSASPYHKGKTCEEHLAGISCAKEEASLRQWMAEVGAKQCPKCKAAVTKNNLNGQNTQRSECHKMICRNCRTKFCFGCLAVLTDTSSCGCTPDEHGFIDPDTGRFVAHLRPGRGQANTRRRRGL